MNNFKSKSKVYIMIGIILILGIGFLIGIFITFSKRYSNNVNFNNDRVISNDIDISNQNKNQTFCGRIKNINEYNPIISDILINTLSI